jgi:hypothetical protein
MGILVSLGSARRVHSGRQKVSKHGHPHATNEEANIGERISEIHWQPIALICESASTHDDPAM